VVWRLEDATRCRFQGLDEHEQIEALHACFVIRGELSLPNTCLRACPKFHIAHHVLYESLWQSFVVSPSNISTLTDAREKYSTQSEDATWHRIHGHDASRPL